MNPETRSVYLDSFSGKAVDVVYGKAYQRTIRCVVVGVAPSLSSSISAQLIVRARYGDKPLYAIASAEILSIEEID
jgi:hypothetical protein